ncbi:MAG TPA: hypothetical protein VNF74_06485 [Terriglobales bacterium]|nr:hypothetical protein [Terriglobales bacterium]
MNGLNTKERNRLPKGRFGLPQVRKYPIPDAAHARSALALAARFATPEQRGEIERNVHRLYPRIKIGA